MTSPRRLRVFLASPGDVGEERALARQILSELPYDALVNWRVVFEVVAWDQPRSGPPLLATMTPQAAIEAGMPKPSECDVVVVILWSRMGTPLPDAYRKPDGSQYRSGTEWEYLEARSAAERTGKPLVLVYRRTEPCQPDPADPHFEERQAQLAQVEAFFAEFRNPDGSIRSGFKDYADPAEFGRIFEDNFRAIIAKALARPDSQAEAGGASKAKDGAEAPQASTTTPVFVGPTARGPLEPQLVTGWDDFVQTYGEGLPSEVTYLAHAVRGFFDNGGGRAYVARVVGSGAAAASATIRSASSTEALDFEASSVGTWGNRLGVRVRKGTRLGIRITVVEEATDRKADEHGGHTLEDWDNLSLDPAAPNFAPYAVNDGPRKSRWVRCWAGPLPLDPITDGMTAWLSGGSDGTTPTAADYLGTWPPEEAQTGLWSTAGLEEVALLCIPDQVHERLAVDDREKITLETVALSERLQDRFTLLSVARARGEPESITPICDSAYAALYAPWVCVEEFGRQGTTWVPALGHIAGVCARSDFERGIQHAPAHEVVRGLDRDPEGRSLEFEFDAAALDTLTRRGVNALGTVETGEVRTLSALTTSTLEELQSIAAQRFLSWIAATIVRGTRWARFEANDEALWRRLTDDISGFLESVWSSGGLSGETPQEAFQVQCDEQTTTQNDIDNGRAICLVHLALMEPASWVSSKSIVIEAGRSPETT